MSLAAPSADATVVVTGASSGIGLEIARGLAQRGYPLTLVARRRERLDDLADELRRDHQVTVEIAPVDLSDSVARGELLHRLQGRQLAGLVNSAGFGTHGPFQSLPWGRERD
ncbi:MAG: SDR family NAD(P)-dependent oxidoreductase, partial [Mycobacterium sp.]